MKANSKNKVRKSTKIDMSGEWESALVEYNKVYNERVTIKQQGLKIEATIQQDVDSKTLEYKFIGQIDGDAINGVYISKNRDMRESGTISLRKINDELYFGSSTYVNSKDGSSDIIQTPYLWAKRNENKIGTYEFCKNCNSAHCCHSDGVDVPPMLPSEVQNISKKHHIPKEEFATLVDLKKQEKDKSLKSIYLMKTSDSGSCYFLKDHQCGIYKDRPIDCRIFPYDIKLFEDGKFYLIYYNAEQCCTTNTSADCLKVTSYHMRIFIRILFPYIREWTLDRFSKTLLNDQPYTVICQIADLF